MKRLPMHIEWQNSYCKISYSTESDKKIQHISQESLNYILKNIYRQANLFYLLSIILQCTVHQEGKSGQEPEVGAEAETM